MRTERNWGSRTGAKRPFWKKGAIIHHLKVVHPAYRKARDEMQELMKAQKNVEIFFAEEKTTKEKAQTR